MKHSPTPWSITDMTGNGQITIVDSKGKFVVKDMNISAENALHIIKCVNKIADQQKQENKMVPFLMNTLFGYYASNFRKSKPTCAKNAQVEAGLKEAG